MNIRKILAVVNPYSHSGRIQSTVATLSELLSDYEVSFVETIDAAEASAYTAEHAAEFDLILPIGGDGTAHAVVNGLMLIEKDKRPPLALLPAGSGNDACRMASIPPDLSAAAAIALTGLPTTFDIGKCNDYYFLNSCSMGVDALIAAKAIEYKKTTKLSGIALYGAALLHVVSKRPGKLNVKLTINGEDKGCRELLFCAITNGKTYGSGIMMNPKADPRDGILTAAVVDHMSFGQIMAALPKLATGKIEEVNQYSNFDITTIKIEDSCGNNIIAQMDGEIIVDSSFEIQVLPAELVIMAPASASASASADVS